MFLGGICESDVLEVVSKVESKKSMDENTTDMSLIKEVMHCVLKPFAYLYETNHFKRVSFLK